MEEEIISSTNVFNEFSTFKKDEYTNLINLIQYLVLGVFPSIACIKLFDKYVPEFDESRKNVELTLEIFIHILLFFMTIIIIDRIIQHIPTYTKKEYGFSSIINSNLIIPLIFILANDSKLSKKITLLSHRIHELWEGEEESPKKHKEQPKVKFSLDLKDDIVERHFGGGGTPLQNTEIPEMASYGDKEKKDNKEVVEFEPANMAYGGSFGTSI